MGGFGSSRWGSAAARATTDEAPALDVRMLARWGALTAGPGRAVVSTVSWFPGGEAADSIVVRHEGDDPDAVVLDYRARPSGAGWAPVRERVPLARTPCPYGGARPWFLCPGCGGRRAVLFAAGGRFRCRRCHDLAYGSTREAPWQRSRRRAEKLRAQLAGTTTLPERPPGMHRRTYERLRRELAAADGAASDGVGARHGALLAGLGQHGGSRR